MSTARISPAHRTEQSTKGSTSTDFQKDLRALLEKHELSPEKLASVEMRITVSMDVYRVYLCEPNPAPEATEADRRWFNKLITLSTKLTTALAEPPRHEDGGTYANMLWLYMKRSDLDQLLRQLQLLRSAAKSNLDDPFFKKPQQGPRRRLRASLDCEIAHALDAGGVPVTTTRDGTLERVLALVHHEVQLPEIDDLSKAVRLAIARLPELRRTLSRGLYPVPKF